MLKLAVTHLLETGAQNGSLPGTNTLPGAAWWCEDNVTLGLLPSPDCRGTREITVAVVSVTMFIFYCICGISTGSDLAKMGTIFVFNKD